MEDIPLSYILLVIGLAIFGLAYMVRTNFNHFWRLTPVSHPKWYDFDALISELGHGVKIKIQVTHIGLERLETAVSAYAPGGDNIMFPSFTGHFYCLQPRGDDDLDWHAETGEYIIMRPGESRPLEPILLNDDRQP